MTSIINYIINKIDEFENYLLQPYPKELSDEEKLTVIKDWVNSIEEIHRELNINTNDKIKKLREELNTI